MRLRFVRVAVAVMMVLFAGVVVAQEPVEIEFQFRDAPVAERWIAEFEALNPHIKVKFTQSPSGSHTAETIVRWAAGVGPDVVEVWGPFAQDFARAGALLDLRPYVERDFTQEEIADFWPAMWEAAHVRYGEFAGEQFRMPRYTPFSVYFFNIDHLQQAGLVDPLTLDKSGGWTYEALRDMARKATIRDGDEVQRYGFGTSTTDVNRMSTWIRAFGGEWFNPNDPTEFMGHTPASVAAMTFLQEMIWQDFSTAPSSGRGDFASGRISIMEQIMNSVGTPDFQSIGGQFEWGVAPVPVGLNGRKTRTGDDGIAIWRNSPQADAAWEFAKFITSTRGQEIQVIEQGHPPVRRSAAQYFLQVYPVVDPWVFNAGLADAGLEISGLMVGDVGQITSLISQALGESIRDNQKPYEVAIKERVGAIEALTRVK